MCNINLVLLQLIEKYVIHLMNALGLDPSSPSINDTYEQVIKDNNK
jgi:hypothetical protein